jgi:hypothetical protein
LLSFFLLVLEIMVGFSLEHKMLESIPSHMSREIVLVFLHRGPALALVFWLHLLALVVCVFLTIMELRRTAPVPKVELHW